MNKFIILLVALCATLNCVGQVTIHMERKDNVFYLPGKVNGLELKFIFDTGASNVYLSLTEALFMIKNGYLTDNDFGDKSYSQVADGSIVENTEVILREIEVAGIKLQNIKALVSNSVEAPLLFGQSAIQQLGAFQLNGNQLTIFNGKSNTTSEDVMNLYQLAYQYAEAGNFDESIELTLQAIEICTDKKVRAELYDNLAYAYYYSNRKDKAIEALIAALGEDMFCEQPAYNLGIYYYEMGQIAKALRALDIYIERHNNTTNKNMLAAAYACKGDCHTHNGENVNAENAYKQSLSISVYPQALLGLADLYLNTKRYNEAIPLYTKALEYEPNRLSNVKRYHQLGFCFAQLNMQSEALETYKKCISTLAANKELIDFGLKQEDEESKYIATYNLHLGFTAQLWVARLSNDPSEAINNYEQVIQLPGLTSEMNFQDFNHWASAYLVNGMSPRAKSKAIDVLTRGLEIFPNNSEILYSLSQCTDEDSATHLDYLLLILESEYTYKPISFDYGTVYNNIAWHYTLNKKFKDGLPYALTAIKLNPEHDYSWETLGQIYFNLGQYDKCIDAMSKCIEISPDTYKSAYELRAKSYEYIGKVKEAKKDFETIKHL